MINTLNIYNELLEVVDEPAAKKFAGVLSNVYDELENSVMKVEFEKLTDVVKDLGEAQRGTEARLEQLAEAQKRTEARLDALTEKMEQLAEAQKKTEARLDALTEKMEQLAEAQKKTEAGLLKLAEEHLETRKGLKKLQKQVGGMSDTIGYGLENQAYKCLPELLRRDFDIEVESRLIRKFIKDNAGAEIEVNIIGEARKGNSRVLIVGESKSQLSKKDVNTFIRKRLNRLKGVHPELFPILVTNMISQPDSEKYAREKGIAVYYSYDFV